MNILRKIALFFISLALFITLPLHTFIWTTRQTLLDRTVILGWLKEGKVYDNIADTLANIAEDSLKNKDETQQNGDAPADGGGNMPDTATLVKAAKVAFPPNILQQNVEAVINSMYNWLEGKTDTIVLNLDFSAQKKVFIDALGNEAITRAASLPTCTTQLTTDFDPLSSDCIPSGVNVAAQAEKIKSELSNSKDFLPDTNISSADLTVGDATNKKLISEQFNFAPKAFKNARDSAYIATGSIAVLALLVFLLGITRRSGLKINAWLFGLAGLWALMLGVVFKLGNSAIVEQIAKNAQTNVGDAAAGTLISQIASTLFTWHMVIGGAYVGVSVFCIIGMKLMKKKDNPTPVAPEKPSIAPAESKAAQKAKPTAVKAQQPVKPNKTTLVQ